MIAALIIGQLVCFLIIYLLCKKINKPTSNNIFSQIITKAYNNKDMRKIETGDMIIGVIEQTHVEAQYHTGDPDKESSYKIFKTR